VQTNYRTEPLAYAREGDRRRNLALAGLLLAVAGVAWAITAHRMQGMDMGPGTELGGFGWFLIVWATMMVAMMLPSLVPMALVHARTGRREASRSPVAGSVLFACGYLLTWIVAGALAYAVFEGVSSLDISWLAWGKGGRYVAGGVILLAALYELTPLKARCLRHCRDPELLTSRWRRGPWGALTMGPEHGGFCVGASWALMVALFAIGIMNVAWMIVIAGLVAIEKLLPRPRVAVGATAVLIALAGLAVAFAPDQLPGLTTPS
jgi:predicted metal-binding membrane protein